MLSSFYGRPPCRLPFTTCLSRVEELLDYPGCIQSDAPGDGGSCRAGERPQPLRQIFTVGKNEMFGTMPGELAALSTFGAKLVSVFGDPDRPGRTRHQGVVVAYDGMTGAVGLHRRRRADHQDPHGLRDRSRNRCARPYRR